MDEKQFKEIISRLDLVIQLLALNMVKDLKTQKDKFLALYSFGLKPKEIANYLSPQAMLSELYLVKLEN
jgi:ABC-type dipeptide/oligopeptide/nickel transport system ATPase subunit